MNKTNILLVLLVVLFSAPHVHGTLNVSVSDQGTDVKDSGEILESGNLTIELWDSPSGGELLLEENFINAISNGSWNVILNASLEYGKAYYKDYEINGVDLDFDGEERIVWYSSLGDISGEDVRDESIGGDDVNESLLNCTQIVGSSGMCGFNKSSSGTYSTAMGYETNASGTESTAMGYSTTASGTASTAMGYETNASGGESTAMGYLTLASESYSTAMGHLTTASGEASLATGDNTLASGKYSLATGRYSTASGNYSTALGYYTNASEDYSTAMGKDTTASGEKSTAMGSSTTASGGYSTAMGSSSTASGVVSTAMGFSTDATGSYSTSMGFNTAASGPYSTAIGYSTTASGSVSTAIGREIESSGDYSVAIALNDQNGNNLTQDNTMAIMGGNVGIGTVEPKTKLEVSSVLRLTPTDSPGSCNADSEGGMYYDAGLNEPCFCNSSAWRQFDGGGDC